MCMVNMFSYASSYIQIDNFIKIKKVYNVFLLNKFTKRGQVLQRMTKK